MTKGPVRAAARSLLRPAPDAVFWDLGAGSGAVAIEAASLLPEGRVYAVERVPRRALDIQENRRRCGAANLHVVLGAAPDCLDALPAPHAVFVGGGLSGGSAAALLATLYDRLAPGGRLAVACVLLDSLAACRRSLRDLDLQTRLFKYRCSYMIYSPAFKALPDGARKAVDARMRQVLTSRKDVAVLEILADTLPGWNN